MLYRLSYFRLCKVPLTEKRIDFAC